MGRNFGKNISKYLSSKNSQKILDHFKNLIQALLKLFQKEQFEKPQ